MAKKENYNDMVINLQEVLKNLEENDLHLEDAMKEYEVGVKLWSERESHQSRFLNNRKPELNLFFFDQSVFPYQWVEEAPDLKETQFQ